MKLDLYLTPGTKLTPNIYRTKCVSAETMIFLEENIGVKFCDLGVDNGVLCHDTKSKSETNKK